MALQAHSPGTPRLVTCVFETMSLTYCTTPKISDGKKGPKLEAAPDSYPINAELVASFTFLNVHPDFVEAVGHWRSRSLKDNDAVELSPHIAEEGPQIFIGPIACGPVVASKEFKDTLKAIHRKVVAIETESGGVFGSLVSSKVPAVVIRGDLRR